MKLLIVVHDLVTEKSHLMPWRTACEVVNELSNGDSEAYLVSLSREKGELSGGLIPDKTSAIRKQRAYLEPDLDDLLVRIKPDVIFWPIAWRDPKWRTLLLKKYKVPVIGWFPGGVYSKSATLFAVKRLGLRATIPYLVEAFIPKFIANKRWSDSGFKYLLAMTQATAEHAICGGWCTSRVKVIPPGKENVSMTLDAGGLPQEATQVLKGRRYFLFMGPPSSIRGVFELLSAYEVAAAKDQNVCLVCLFRSDGVLEKDSISNRLSSMDYRDRIFVCWQSLLPGELNNFIEASYAIVMPFVLVPSEIPLAIIEAARWGKPVISTSPGGTGEFVNQFGMAPMVGDIRGITDAMLRLMRDSSLYKEKSSAAQSTYQHHPTWSQVAAQWLELAGLVLSFKSRG